MIDIYYLNTQGQRIDFDNRIYCIAEMKVYSHSLNYESENERIIQYVTKIIREMPLTMNISDYKGVPWQQSYDTFIDVTMYDVLRNERGYLYVGDYYLRCNIIGMNNEDQFREWCDFQTSEITIISDNPVWIREKTIQFKPENRPEEPEVSGPIITGGEYGGSLVGNQEVLRDFMSDFKRPDNRKASYPLFDLPFDFMKIYGRRIVENDSATASDFVMTFHGFVDHPSIMIGDHVYAVNAMIYEGERIVIDSAAGTVIKVGRLGEITNLYNSRNKAQSVFEKIPPGIMTLSWPGTFGVDITLFDERVQPRWSL